MPSTIKEPNDEDEIPTGSIAARARECCLIPFFKKALMVTVRLSLNIICTKGADDMSDHDEWISYSHWGMFTLERKSSRQSN